MPSHLTPSHVQSGSALFLITSDPRKSHLPAEGIRIATGVSVWQKTPIILYLGSAMVAALNDSREVLDEKIIDQHLPDLLPTISQLLIPAETDDELPGHFAHCNWNRVGRSELAQVLSRCGRLLRF